MKKNKLFIVIIIIIIFIIGIILLSKKRVMNKFTFPTELIIKNNTAHNGVDTIAMVILNKIMKIDTINIQFYNIKDGLFKDGSIDIMAFIEKVSFNKHQYVIFLAKDFKNNNISEIIGHEMVHVKQMENGELVQSISHENYSIYKNDTIFYLKIPYEIRPFEIDAVKEEKSFSNDLYKILYK